ncbi:UNVERIFIED_CONTAM: Dirigent protein 24 [Sesamum latifolium]|uniref:Dirigent protein n=1 Tax=Sesamum latifolium TaxID=2727402 RepID=A0AAW2XH74_9LAMI
MPKFLILSPKSLDSIICFLLLATTFATSTRLLDDLTSQFPVSNEVPNESSPITLPETQPIATTTASTTNVAPISGPPTLEEPAPVIAPVPPQLTTPTTTATSGGATTTPTTDLAPVADPSIGEESAPVVAPVPPPLTTPTATATSGGAAIGTNSAISDHPTLSFFMHDILGGTHPSGRVVTGVVANSDANNLPFSKPNNQIFPINGGVPLNTINGVINNNNYPSLIGLNGSPANTLVQSNGNNVVASNNQAFVTAGQLPAGLTLQQLMFGTVTVVDNEITEGHELGTSVLGRAQGFYMVSSSDGSSHTVALTAAFHGGEHDHEILDTVSFFGVHRTATPISHIAIVGGTGKYENAKGYATIETLPHVDQHTTDGLETITHFTLYLTP